MNSSLRSTKVRGSGAVIAAVSAIIALVLAACGPDEGRDLAAPRAEEAAPPPSAPVLYLHFDYMVQDAPDAFSPAHSDAPHQASLDSLVEAFRRRGITVVIDPHHSVLPHEQVTTLPCGDDPLATLREGRFAPRDPRPWHYLVFAHHLVACGQQVSGLAEIGGFNFVVAVGVLFHNPPFGFSACAGDFSYDNGVCVDLEAGTLLHELGHNLDLRHGGQDDENRKPNYLSVMNYRFQGGIPFAAAPGDTMPIGVRLDFSDRALPALDENRLDERVGLGGPPDDRDITSYDCLWGCTGGITRQAPATGPVDWNGDGTIEPSVALDLDYIGLLLGSWDYPPQLGVLAGFDDWAHIQQFLRTPAYVAGTLRARRAAP